MNFMTFHFIYGNVIFPTDELHHFSRWLLYHQPSLIGITSWWHMAWNGWWMRWVTSVCQLVTHLFTNRGLLLDIIPVNGMVYLLALPHILADDCSRSNCGVPTRDFWVQVAAEKNMRCPLIFSRNPIRGPKKMATIHHARAVRASTSSSEKAQVGGYLMMLYRYLGAVRKSR